MRVSLNWLREFVDLPTSDPGELSRALAMLGHEVEGVEVVKAGWSDVVISRVDTVDPHPDADKVRVCTVDTGGGDPVTVVCGAWNFEAGALVAFARPGAVLPGDFEIGVRAIRGVESNGMICSEKELAIGEDAAGILVLPDDAPVGKPLEEILSIPDTVFDLTITPNRPDAMSMLGIARDLAAWYDTDVTVPTPNPATVTGPAGINVVIEDPEGNPRFVARRVDGVEVKESPLWMRMRLRTAGMRPISNLVDVTNYVMLELGQPLHVFDTDRLAGEVLTVRRAHDGEHLVTLDGVDRELTSEDLVICDEDGPTSMSGTMGGDASEVSIATRSTIIEGASWDPPTIMYMSRRHGLRSEASARFERGVDPELPPRATARAAELVLELAGGELRESYVDQIARPHHPLTLELELRAVRRVLGERFDSETVKELLIRLGFDLSGEDPLRVGIPSYRPDVTRPVDLIEEVARLADYDTFGERLRLGRGGGLTWEQRMARRLRQVLSASGFSQAVTLPFVMPEELAALDPPPDHELRETIEVKNPLSDDEAILRPSLLPGILGVLRRNRNRGQADVAVFEVGRVFHGHPWPIDKRVPDQPMRLAMAAIGEMGEKTLSGDGRSADIHTVTASVRHLADSLGLLIELEQATSPGFHPTRTAAIRVGDSIIGYVGELHPMSARAFELEQRVAVAEIDHDALLGAHREPAYRPVSPYPPADFDLSFEVEKGVPARHLEETIRRGGGVLVESISTFDEFTGGNLDETKKALALRIRLRAPDRTLTTEEIAETRSAMIEAASEVGASLRGGA